MNKKQLTHAFALLCLVGASYPADAASNTQPGNTASDNAAAGDTVGDKPGSANDDAVKKLLAQASYWHSKAHDDMAMEALQKVLAVDNHNIDAMYLMALYQMQSGNTQQAAIWRKKISDISPDDPHLASLDGANSMQTISRGQLNTARDLARSGHIKEAIATYRTLLHGNPPPDELALEYYQTLAGDSDTWQQGVDGLRRRAHMLPGDAATQLALGSALTWQESGRREGIAILSGLAPDNKIADKALQQALLWLNPKATDLPVYTAYASRHPDDTAPMDHYRKSVDGGATKAAFDALNGGDLSTAKTKFTEVLKTQPKDSNALAGLGYVALRQGDFTQAETLLRQASAQDTGNTNDAQWTKDADNAHFYGTLNLARSMTQKGQYAEALNRLDNAQGTSTDQRQAADMLRADIYRRQGKLSDAEQVYRQLLDEHPQNTTARTSLFWILKQEHKETEAAQILRTLPARLRTRYASWGDNGDEQRKAAEAAIKGGNTSQAMQILQAAVAKYPQNAWLKLDYARLLRQSGEKQRAAVIMSALPQQSGLTATQHNDALYASAVYFVEDDNWSKAQSLMSQVPTAHFSDDMRALNSRILLNRQLDIAQNYIKQGNRAAALNSLRILSRTPPQAPVDAGRLAELLMQAGDSASALALVRNSQAQGLQGSLADYASQIRVLNQAGLFAQAESVLNAPALQNASSQEEIDRIRLANLITQADTLRAHNKIRAAWDLVMPALRNNPTNTDLLLTVARIYQADHMTDKADEIYQYVLRKSPQDRQALTGEVWLSLARNDSDKAKQYFSQLEPNQNTDYLLLAAHVAAAQGQNQQAMSLLRTARWRIQSDDVSNGDDAINSVLSIPSPTQQTQLTALNDIDSMMRNLQEKAATWTGGAVSIRSRNGEAGLGQLTKVKAPMTVSGTLGDSNARLSLDVAPVTLNAGEMSGESANRFGYGAISHAAKLAAATSTSTTSTNADSQGSQQANGVETHLSLSGDSYKLDVGSTPTGGQMTRLVGGMEWKPQLTDHSSLDLKAERRAVTDSLLSYVGAKDKTTGEKWGAITRNGVSAQYAWDNDLVGLYTKLGFDTYLGTNVPTNHSVNAMAGSYIRLYQTPESELRMGVNVNYMDFQRNLSYFTTGQGGYFSPQDYMSLTLPVTFSRHWGDWDMTLSGSVGYQSYKQDQSDYYPGHSSLQSTLESYASSDDDVDSVYKATAKNGIGYTLGVDARYRLNDNVALGANLGYDTFGSYNEGKALIYFKYYVDQDN